jgi:HAD superfamily hydrolase (TIGR01490 family)
MTKAACNLALFDLDHTLLPTDSDHEWGRFMVKLGIVEEPAFSLAHESFYADYKAGCLDIHAYLRFSLAPLARYSRAQFHEWHSQFMAEVIEPALLPVALELVREHQEAGDLCCLITATNAFVTEPIGRAFGIESLIAPMPATLDGDPHGPYTGELDGIPSFQEGKIIRTEAWLKSLDKDWSSFARSYFYSDSRNDIPLLEKVTDPIATNPDPTLREHALQKGWRILELFEAK